MKSVAQTFAKFYSSLAESLLHNLPNSPNKFDINSVHHYYKNIKLKDNFNINLTTEKKVLKVLQFIDIPKAAGIDKISGRFLRDGANILARPTSNICNISISSGLLPSDCKIAKLKPLYKKESKTNPENIRPISLLPLISKVIERIAYDQVDNFLLQNNILYNYQSGFRKNHSTDLCLSFLNNKILKGFDKGLFTGMILIDLQKAFDAINHEILPGKLHAIGFSEKTVAWFKSYLSDRAFKVNINNRFSDLPKINCGVPQGSILGPLLFLLYVNDMPQTVHSDLLLYADDSGLTFQHKHVYTIEYQLNKDFANLCKWFVGSKLSIHLGEEKTKCILFGSKLKLKNAGKLNIMFNGIEIKQYSKVTYLGCLLDETMSGESISLKTIKRINQKLKFLYRKNRFLTPELRRLLCNAIIQPHLDYACSAWYPNLTQKLKKKFQVM